jgi:hypothetical protein
MAMPHGARAVETRPLRLTRHPRPAAPPRQMPKGARAVRCCAVGHSPRTTRIAPSKAVMAIAWIGMRSRSARPARKTSLFGKPALEAGRDEKARSVVALSRVPRLAGFAGSPPAADSFAAVNRPLVRIPANQHTTTGTCEIGQEERYAIRHALQEFFFGKSPVSPVRMVKTYVSHLAR